MKQPGLICQVIVLFTGTMILWSCGEAANPFTGTILKIFSRGPKDAQGLCIGYGLGSLSHLNAIGGIIVDMGMDCQSEGVETETMYVGEVTRPKRKLLYSFTHGVVSISEDETQHIFPGLGLASWNEFYGIPRSRWVQHSDLPVCSSYKPVFINACHSGDLAVEYTESQSRSSAATNFKNRFPNAVYIAARGGNNENPIVHSCSKCLEQTLAKNMAVDFFERIKNLRANGQNPTFGDVKDVWDPEDDPDPEPSHYTIMLGSSTHILSIFPRGGKNEQVKIIFLSYLYPHPLYCLQFA